jgi:hypothetical protein
MNAELFFQSDDLVGWAGRADLPPVSADISRMRRFGIDGSTASLLFLEY